jgi:hypothetical protein
MQNQKINPVQVGDIFVYSWGYEQTNVNFYQVISTTPKTMKLVEIAQERTYDSSMSGKATPVKDKFIMKDNIAKVLTKRFNVYGNGQVRARMDNGLLHQYEKPEFFSSWY